MADTRQCVHPTISSPRAKGKTAAPSPVRCNWGHRTNSFIFSPHLRTCFHWFERERDWQRERERGGGGESERERIRERQTDRQRKKHWLVAYLGCPTRDWTCNLGMCPDWESNWQPFSAWNDAQTTEPHGQGKANSLMGCKQPDMLCYLWSRELKVPVFSLCSLLLLPRDLGWCVFR